MRLFTPLTYTFLLVFVLGFCFISVSFVDASAAAVVAAAIAIVFVVLCCRCFCFCFRCFWSVLSVFMPVSLNAFLHSHPPRGLSEFFFTEVKYGIALNKSFFFRAVDSSSFGKP